MNRVNDGKYWRTPTCHVTMPRQLRELAFKIAELETIRRGEFISTGRLFREAFEKVWCTPELMEEISWRTEENGGNQ